MPKLETFTAEDIFEWVDCDYIWSLQRIKNYLKKNGRKRVNALWVAQRKDIYMLDRLWVLLAPWPNTVNVGLVPKHIRKLLYAQIEKNAFGYEGVYYKLVKSVNLRRWALKEIIRRLKEYEKK